MTNLIIEIEAYNNYLDTFYNEILPTMLNVDKDGKIKLTEWFKAQEIINKQNFYNDGMFILNKYRKMGYDVKMNMQTYKLVY